MTTVSACVICAEPFTVREVKINRLRRRCEACFGQRRGKAPLLLTLAGTTRSAPWWARQRQQRALGLTRDVLRTRKLNGWSDEATLTTPCRGYRAAADVAVEPSEPRYIEDIPARRFVLRHPHGADRYAVAAFFGITNERVRQIEERALRRAEKRCELAGITAEDFAAALAAKARHPLDCEHAEEAL